MKKLFLLISILVLGLSLAACGGSKIKIGVVLPDASEERWKNQDGAFFEAELEAQLLTGKQINMSKARELALSNDLAGLSNELFKNSVEVAEYGKMNRIQQQALAKSMGVTTEQLAKMAYNRGLDTNMSEEQLKAATGLERSDYERMAAQEKMATT